MGQLATATHGTQLVKQQSPERAMKMMLEKNWPRIQAVMPKHMSSERLFQLAVSAINQTPGLMQCDAASLLSCVMKCSALGLEPSAVDGLGRAYILPYRSKTGMHAQLIVGYRGMLDLSRRSGQLKSIHAQAVYQGDEFDHWEDETGQHFKFKAARDIEHKPELLTDVYVCAQLKDGGFVFETMTKKEVDAIRKRSKASNNGPWVTDYEAMALKTVIRRSFRYLPVSVEAQQAASADETTPDYTGVLNPVIDGHEVIEATGEVVEDAPEEEQQQQQEQGE